MNWPEPFDVENMNVGDLVNYVHPEQANPVRAGFYIIVHIQRPLVALTNFSLGGIMEVHECNLYKLNYIQLDIIKAWTLATIGILKKEKPT